MKRRKKIYKIPKDYYNFVYKINWNFPNYYFIEDIKLRLDEDYYNWIHKQSYIDEKTYNELYSILGWRIQEITDKYDLTEYVEVTKKDYRYKRYKANSIRGYKNYRKKQREERYKEIYYKAIEYNKLKVVRDPT